MTKKEICQNNKTFAYYSGLNGLELKDIEYGIDDYIICQSGSWGGPKGYHRCKVYYSANGNLFFRCMGYKIPLCECIRT